MASSKKGSSSSTAGSNIVSSVEIQRTTADLRNQILESLTGLGELGRGLSGFNGSLRQAGDLIVQVSSSGQMLVQNISKLAEAIRQAKEIKMTSSGAAATSTAGDVAGSASGVSGALGGGSGGGGSIFGAVLGGLGAGASLISGIVGIFRQRREEEKKYQREMQQALNDQLSAEVELSLATSRRLADEQAITREKYKQIESGLQQASGNRQEVLSEIDDRMQELYAEMNGQYSARYKRGASNYYNALLELKNHQDDLDWLETVGSSPLMPSSDESYGEYQSFYERLLALAQQEKDWVEQQKSLAEELIGSSAQSLADSWVEAFRKGEEATWDFAKNFEDVMRQAIINGFSDSVILAQIDPIFNKFREKVMDFLAGEIDLDEVVTPELEAQIEQTAEKIKELSPELSSILEKLGLEVDNSSSQTLSAAIKGVSEQTASLVAGQMNAIRTNQIKSMETLSDSLSALVAIESNTRYNRYLESIDRRLGTLLSNGSLRAAGLV